jgi:maltose alpha-D-glucosyltransferase/alpha-amylase
VTGNLVSLAGLEVPVAEASTLGTFLEYARLLGQRTGELHVALASEPTKPEFAPDAFTPFYQRSLFQSMRNRAMDVLGTLKQRLKELPPDARPLATQVLALQQTIVARLRAVHERPIIASRIRIHGDYHLAQVLFTGKDFVFVDFEGPWARPLSERRIKYSPLRDVAGVIRSFHYVVNAALRYQQSIGNITEQQMERFEPWSRYWFLRMSGLFLAGYVNAAKDAELIPLAANDLSVLLNAHLLDKAMSELGSELNDHFDRVAIPLRGITALLE